MLWSAIAPVPIALSLGLGNRSKDIWVAAERSQQGHRKNRGSSPLAATWLNIFYLIFSSRPDNSCGGDGSFRWIASLLHKKNCPLLHHTRRPLKFPVCVVCFFFPSCTCLTPLFFKGIPVVMQSYFRRMMLFSILISINKPLNWIIVMSFYLPRNLASFLCSCSFKFVLLVFG